EIELGNLSINPSPPLSAFGPASVDLTLSNEFRTFVSSADPILVTADIDYRDHTETIIIPEGGYFELKAGESCLGITEETLDLPPTLCGLLEGRSRFARLGIAVHVTASFMNPGICNRQVLEIFNCSPRTIRLVPGIRLCQFIFLRMHGEAKYEGRFKAQSL
ncbi:deoxycytidine triphosphate deaminase, partial [Kipferlia bialata]